MSQQELTATVTELQELRRMQEELEREIESITDRIKTHMGEREELITGPFKVLWKRITSTRVDTTALKKALPEIADRFSKTTETRRFSVQ